MRGFVILLTCLCVMPHARAAELVLGPEQAARIKQQVDAALRDELKRGWYPRVLDHELGGFHQNFARDWKPLPDDNRFLVYQARITWTAAAFAEFSPEDRVEYTKYAREGVEILDRTMRDRDFGGFHWVVAPDGKVDERLGSEKHVYGTAFALYASSKVYSLCKDDRALADAREAFNWLEEHAHDAKHGGYYEALTREGEPILKWDAHAPLGKRIDRLGTYYGFKSMNSHIHLLEALTEFYKAQARPPVKERLRETFEIVRDKIAVEPGALNLYFTPDWRATPAHDSFGHDIETAFLLIEAAEALGIPDDERTWSVARSLVDHALDWGWDEEHGGFYDKGQAFAGGAFEKNKIWWTQAEGLNSLLLMHERYGRETDRYARAFLKLWSFIDGHMVDKEHGGWFQETTPEGRLVGDGKKATQWKANYHNARALMNVSARLGKIH